MNGVMSGRMILEGRECVHPNPFDCRQQTLTVVLPMSG